MNSKVEIQSSKIDLIKWSIVAVLIALGIVANSHFANQPVALRLIGWLVLVAVAVFIALKTSQGHQFWSFAQDARIEMRKVVWPTRQETFQTTLIVVTMVVIAGLALWGVDSMFLWLVGLLTGQRG